ncbi:MAG TPA: DUF4062 domain-containing protein [Micromonosporaceae bacterium]|nr:DUF4062 domain-containing protein [Micromonosporaceae bacterium]
MTTNSAQQLVRVFVSHTSDMAAYPTDRSFVQAILDAVSRAKLVAVDMRYFAAGSAPSAEYCRQRVRECEIYVALVGFRYGSIVPGDSISYTELEFNEATAAGRPRLVFLLDENAELPAAMSDSDQGPVRGFRQRLYDGSLIVRTFTSATGLELEVFHALIETVDTRRSTSPRQLPPDVSAFTGRSEELSELDGLLAAVDRASTQMISAVSGTAGVGKTALVVHWAHRVAPRFPDGHLYADLRGYDPERPMSTASVLTAFLRALGVPAADIPHEADELAARYRTLLDGRRMLVVLDNAASSEQVRLLLPGTRTVLTVVTSRDRLAALVVRHGARRVDLDLLPLDDAIELLRTLIGRRASTSNPRRLLNWPGSAPACLSRSG